MNLARIAQGVKAVADVARSDNPGAAAGKAVAAAVTVAHPVAGAILHKPIAAGVERAVNKGIEIAKDPVVQAKVKQVGTDVGNKAIEIGSDAARAARRGATSAVARVQAFRAGHGR
jgi:hypothetical protein